MAITLHPLPIAARQIPPPEQFTYPFCYEPHPTARAAADEVRRYLSGHPEWHEELGRGKMLGVLVVEGGSFLAAFSGTLDGKTQHEYFVPPVFDLMAPDCYFGEEEAAISRINRQIEAFAPRGEALERASASLHQQMEAEFAAYRKYMQQSKARRDWIRQSLPPEGEDERQQLIRESQYQKAEYRRLKKTWAAQITAAEAPLRELRGQIEQLWHERHQRSKALQQWLFRQFQFLNARGETQSLLEIFSPSMPPSGAGECCAPRLLQAAYKEGLKPLCMAEFWVGASPTDEIRHEGHYYPACNSKCRPILQHMLQGLNVEPNPLQMDREQLLSQLHIIYKDSEMSVVSKPSGLLSVPGKDDQPCVLDAMRRLFPTATGPLIVHRLDMDTSGLMLIALNEEKYHELQTLFLQRRIHKVYHALLENEMPVGQEGDISLPLRPDYDDRPRQMVDTKHGKPAQTHYRVLKNRDGHALLELRPLTGRTHQLRIHCAHPLGLGNPIVGDRLYGHTADRLMLHAFSITFDGHTFMDNYEL